MNRWSLLFIVVNGIGFALYYGDQHGTLDLPEDLPGLIALFLFGSYVTLVAYYGRDDSSDGSIVARERRAQRAGRKDMREQLSLPLQMFLGVVLANTIAAMLAPTLVGFAIANAIGLVFGALAHRWVAAVPGFFDRWPFR
jgi:hypothetical protein